MSNIPTKSENPTGLHRRYIVGKTDNDGHWVDADREAEYFIMRLDEGGKDREHIKACRIGVNAYADAIEHHLPELAKDLRERYPLLND